MDPVLSLREHVHAQTSTLIRRMAFQARRASLRPDEDAVHDLRVSIRRLRECLRTFEDLFPPKRANKLRRELRTLMKAAEKVRTDDIALELLGHAQVGPENSLAIEIQTRRKHHQHLLREALIVLGRRPYTQVWRRTLGLP